MITWVNITSREYLREVDITYNESLKAWIVPASTSGFLYLKAQHKYVIPKQIKIRFEGNLDVQIKPYFKVEPYGQLSSISAISSDLYYVSGRLMYISSVHPLTEFIKIEVINNSLNEVTIYSINITEDQPTFLSVSSIEEIYIKDQNGNFVDSFFNSKIVVHNDVPYIMCKKHFSTPPYTWSSGSAITYPGYSQPIPWPGIWGFVLKKDMDGEWRHLYEDVTGDNRVYPYVPGQLIIGANPDFKISKQGIFFIGSTRTMVTGVGEYIGFTLTYNYLNGEILDYDDTVDTSLAISGEWKLSDTYGGKSPSIDIDSLSNVLGCYISINNTQIRVHKHHISDPPLSPYVGTDLYPNKYTFKIVENITGNAAYNFDFAKLIVDKNDVVNIVYTQGAVDDTQELKCVKTLSNGSWDAPYTLMDGGYFYYTKVLLSPSNKIHVLSLRNASIVGYEWYHFWFNGTWQEEVLHFPTDEFEAFVDYDDVIHAFTENRYYVQNGQDILEYVYDWGAINKPDCVYFDEINAKIYLAFPKTNRIDVVTIDYNDLPIRDLSLSSESSRSESMSQDSKSSESVSSEQSSSSISSESSEIIPGLVCINDRLDSSNWNSLWNGSWDAVNSRYVGLYGGDIRVVEPIGWGVGLRPQSVKMTIEIVGATSAMFVINVYSRDEEFNYYYLGRKINATIQSNVPFFIPLDFSDGFDIHDIQINEIPEYTYYLTEINFCPELSASSYSSLSSSSESKDSKSSISSQISISSISSNSRDKYSDSSISFERRLAATFLINENENVSLFSSSSSHSSFSFLIGWS